MRVQKLAEIKMTFILVICILNSYEKKSDLSFGVFFIINILTLKILNDSFFKRNRIFT